ncbi:exported hypothetical protein [Candidatus Terasakiella magnetica]|uniref:Lipoprotein n=1 Tax=Candidatus Terasakiella magnetica TaxID=1867952 RepID=A0A1C3REE3_9PROT|nr:hypothetical protein [Candidatus Terasakiella magnetica]SCA55625.1 exported hypothetical protein [Candidatus Terasakiella magnetica]
MLKRLICLSLLLLVVACTQAPQPMRHSRTGFDTTPLRLRDSGTVLIQPIEGAARPLAKIMAASLADSLGVRNIPSTSNPVTNTAYKVRGQVVLKRARNAKKYTGEIYWTFFSRDDKIVHESSQAINVDRYRWDYGDQHMINQLVENAAETFADYIQDKAEREAVKLDERNQQVVFKIASIKGVKPSAQKELYKAMALTLRQAGAIVRPSLSPQGYQLSCEIDVLEPYEGKQRIKVAWIVKDASGKELGRARQNNRLNEGRLEKPLGRMAYNIARAAMGGVGQMVERHREEIRFERSRTQPSHTAAPGRRKRLVAPPF